MSGEPSLAPGENGEWVVYLQELLTHNDHPLTPDGNFGAETEQAVAQFQQSRGLPATGAVDPATWAELTGESALRYE